MDIIFNCPNCEQELAVDQSGAGSNIECPNCSESITIPASSNPKVTTGSLPAVPPPPPPSVPTTPPKLELHLKVPISDKPAAPLIGKSKPPLEVVQKGAGKRLRVRTIRRASCVESGHDHFDERVSDFLQEVGEGNIVGIHTVTYEYFDVGVQKIVADYGLLVIFRG